MNKIGLITLILLIGNCFLISKKEKINIRTTKYQVIVKEGAIRKEPSIKSPTLGKVLENEMVEVIEFLDKKETLTIKYGFRDKWAKVLFNGDETGYIFGSLIQLASLNDYQCPQPLRLLNVKIKGEGSYLKICSDGSYELSEYYNCEGYNCSEHGCFDATKKKITLIPKKEFYYKGVGEPEVCTHGCTYSVYSTISKFSSRKPHDLKDTFEYGDLNLEKFNPKDSRFEITELPKGYNCRYNQLF
ncbi:hypothetical protein CH373_16890 [Leptospira perolatii]|uniref:SH3b domain-containing protein n=1 Tax=Leptospira perolatii TaxID=2023191 RepID=A0A2M9ZIM8_9LEPT|nr:SH3 domain-containing protein [Leptospira perolatii]PJZ68463.1 hypothetical protein CH360_16110 [Leptospira perolatii]PJZ71909.1 hypothetical protein CH373_16890 [Leptospira perolatii]